MPLVVAAASPQLFATDARKPDILIILTDDQGWGDIGYNNPKVYSPDMDRLAAEGATLTQHYVMPQCTPTQLALFTGRYLPTRIELRVHKPMPNCEQHDS